MKKRILASVLVLVMLICLLPVTAIADGNEGLKVEGQTVMIYNAEDLRAWAASITDDHKNYDGYKVSIENDIDLSGPKWTSIIGLGGTITIDGNNHTISNMRIDEQGNGKDGNTYLGFIGDIAYGTRLTIQNITFENAHVQDPGGDSQYSWAAVVVGHGPMDCRYNYNYDIDHQRWTITPCDNATCTFKNITVKNSVVTGGHNSAAILGYASSTEEGHLFENCQVLNTFVGGYHSTSAVLFSMGFANVRVENCSASGVLLYSDGLTSPRDPDPDLFTNYNSDLWLGTLYRDYWTVGDTLYLGIDATLKFFGTNTATNCAIVYPVVFHYSNNTDIKEYVRVNTPLKGTWYAEEACTTPVTQIIGSSMYPEESTKSFVNDEAYETQDTKKDDNPLTHAVIHLYTKEKYVPEQPTTDYLIPGFGSTPTIIILI